VKYSWTAVLHQKLNRKKATMKAMASTAPGSAPGAQNKAETSKLISLLALAAGAATIPQTGIADIIYTPGGETVSFDTSHFFTIMNLPGNAQIGFTAHAGGTFSSIRSVTMGKRGSGYINMKVALLGPGRHWGTIAPSVSVASHALLGTANDIGYGGRPFNNLYITFEFKDSSQAGDPLRYGWINLSMANGNLSTFLDYPKVTVNGWAYDTTGAQVPTGAVPEPNSMSLLALGALALGAKGVRTWRRNRHQTGS
jgi:hypothetical protein